MSTNARPPKFFAVYEYRDGAHDGYVTTAHGAEDIPRTPEFIGLSGEDSHASAMARVREHRGRRCDGQCARIVARNLAARTDADVASDPRA